MTHRPIILEQLAVRYAHKTCFEHFSTTIHAGSKIAVIGRNGTGKSTLLKIIQGLEIPADGHVQVPAEVIFGYVPQIVEEYNELSGGQRFNKMLSAAFALQPNVLILDEPTNHLDMSNRRSLMRMLHNFSGTLLVASHDVELLRTCVNTLWMIEEGTIHVFLGTYDDYMREYAYAEQERIHQIGMLEKEKKKVRLALEHERARAASKRRINKDENDRALKERMKETASHTMGKNQGKLNVLKKEIDQAQSELWVSEIVKPSFVMNAQHIKGHRTVIEIKDGSCGYAHPILKDINMSFSNHDRVGLLGDNGSGKSTLLKALCRDPHVYTQGYWLLPRSDYIGYLDQHYILLNPHQTALEMFHSIVPTWTFADVRRYLNDFLFRKNEEVQAPISTLSGGEKMRLALACLAARNPTVLLLDEATNNIDLITRKHLVEVLNAYTGALIVISHDQDFLKEIHINTMYIIKNGTVSLSA